jgi:hypothetical protein
MSYKIFVDSSKRTSNSNSSTDFHVQFTGNFPEVQYAELHWEMIPLSTYTISSTNNTIYFKETLQTSQLPYLLVTILVTPWQLQLRVLLTALVEATTPTL